MLDFLLVLGQIPGTHLFLTFNGFALVILVWAAYYVERLHRPAIRNYLKWAEYRAGVHYRRMKRIIKSYLKLQRHKLSAKIRQTKRAIRTAIRNAYKATVIAALLTTRRSIRRLQTKVRQTKRAIVFQTVTLPKRKIRRSRMIVRRAYRNFLAALYRRYRRAYRLAMRKNRKLEKSLKASKVHGLYAGVSVSIRPSSRN